jgi:hypothetical protein
MIDNYKCEKCGWTGNYPNICGEEHEDGGYPCCPNGCKGKDNEPLSVIIQEGSEKYFRLLKVVYGGGRG